MDGRSSIGPVQWNKECYALIHKAVLQQNNARIEKLLSISPYSLETKTADKHKLTPLLVAASYGCEETFHFLLQLKAKVTAKSTRDFNAVQCALVQKEIKLVTSLLDRSDFSVFRDIFLLLSAEPFHTRELANTLEVLHYIVDSHIMIKRGDGKEKKYEERIKLADGIAKLAALMDVCLKQKEILESIGLILMKVIESMSYSEYLYLLLLESPIVEYQLKLASTLGSSEAVYSLQQVICTMVSRGHSNRVITLHAPKICLEATKKTKDDKVMMHTISCMKQWTDNVDMVQYFHSDGILHEFVKMMVDSSPSIVSLLVQFFSIVASIDESFRLVVFELKTIEKALQILNKKQCTINYDIIRLLHTMCMQKGDVEDTIKQSEAAKSILLHMIKNSINADNQRKAFEILWLVAAEDLEEKRALASLVGPTSLIIMLSMATSCSHQMTATTALGLLSPPLYGLQKEITSNGGIQLLLKVIQSEESQVVQFKALQVLENCSHDIALRPNTEVQKAVLRENGVQLLLRVQVCSIGTLVQLQCLCTLAAISIGSTKIKNLILTDPLFSLEDLLTSFSQLNPQADAGNVLMVARTLSYLAYNHTKTQKMIINTKRVPVKPLKDLLTCSSSTIKLEAAFYIIILAHVFDKSAIRVEMLTVCIQHLVGALQTALEEGDEKNQVQICTYVSALLAMNKLGGICQAFVSMDMVSLLVKVIFKESEHCRKTSAITLNYITKDKTGARVILAYCRRFKELYQRIRTYSKGFTLDKDFVERWHHYELNYLRDHMKVEKESMDVTGFPMVLLRGGEMKRRQDKILRVQSELKLPPICPREVAHCSRRRRSRSRTDKAMPPVTPIQ